MFLVAAAAAAAAAAGGHNSANYVNTRTFCVSCYCRTNLRDKHNAAH